MSQFAAKSVCILGRQPTLGLVELESLYGAEQIKPIKHGVLLDIPAGEINFKRLGGTLKVAKLLNVLPASDWKKIYKYLTENIPRHLQHVPGGTFTLGVSLYGLELPVSKLNTDLLLLKKIIRAQGRSVRIVPNKTLELNSAQVLHNKLTRRGAWELLAIRNGSQTYLAQTFFVQDIEAYAARDQARPKRDARVGMLPPKLAQILINLAVGEIESAVGSRQSAVKKLATSDLGLKTTRALRVLDPFCGTGVILQEALLMGYDTIGSDIEPRMIEFSKTNLDWLLPRFDVQGSRFEIFQADATNHKWQQQFDAVASELYLGRPLSELPVPQKLNEIVQDVNTITKKFLSNIAAQIPKGTRLSLAVPAWRPNVIGLTYHKKGFVHLPVIDHLTDMGYNRIDFVHVKNDELIYFREDQIVARELLVLERLGIRD
ncbi:methyltransferase domain-containing protein [Candidatus Saccharibacteria bacterium]|nr:methyltransferase domain-containing protein [Candidatus Saccharibacteria bacterium]